MASHQTIINLKTQVQMPQRNRRLLLFCTLFFFTVGSFYAQQDSLVLGFKEYLGYVKKLLSSNDFFIRLTFAC